MRERGRERERERERERGIPCRVGAQIRVPMCSELFIGLFIYKEPYKEGPCMSNVITIGTLCVLLGDRGRETKR